jgi:DNA (cytosine-5)-methyltransferase 1
MKPLIYGSLCSGIEAASMAWKPLGWRCAFTAEIEAFPSAVLAHHHGDAPNLGDMTRINPDGLERTDVVVAGTPCQSFSVAGLRKGLADPRGNLALDLLRIVDGARPEWLVWENVPGVLSSWSDAETSDPSEESRRLLEADGLDPDDFVEVEQTNDFDQFTSGIRELGYGLAWGSLDAQYFGLAQRRERVFVVAHLGDWTRAAAVLFDRESLSGNPAPSREAGAGTSRYVAASIRSSGAGTSRVGDTRGQDNIVASEFGDECGLASLASGKDIAPTLMANYGDKWGLGDQETFSGDYHVCHSLRADGFDASEDGTGRGTPLVPVSFATEFSNQNIDHDLAGTLHRRAHSVCYRDDRGRGNDRALEDGTTYPLHCAKGQSEQQIVAFAQNQRDEVRTMEVIGALAGEPGMKQQTYVAIPLQEVGKRESKDQNGVGIGIGSEDEPMYTLQAGAQHGVAQVPVAFQTRIGRNGRGKPESIAPTLQGASAGATSDMRPCVSTGMAVRRLTPRECERLQGFPDDYTLISHRGKPSADGPRYRALGNSMAVPVMRWIGERIDLVRKAGAA